MRIPLVERNVVINMFINQRCLHITRSCPNFKTCLCHLNCHSVCKPQCSHMNNDHVFVPAKLNLVNQMCLQSSLCCPEFIIYLCHLDYHDVRTPWCSRTKHNEDACAGKAKYPIPLHKDQMCGNYSIDDKGKCWHVMQLIGPQHVQLE